MSQDGSVNFRRKKHRTLHYAQIAKLTSRTMHGEEEKKLFRKIRNNKVDVELNNSKE